MNTNVIEFYKKVRADKGLQEALSEGKTVDEIADIAVKKAATMDIALAKADVLAACGDIPGLIGQAVNDDELTEIELELIAAGGSTYCVGGKV